MGLASMLIDQTGSGEFKRVASKLQLWPPSGISQFPFRSKIIPKFPTTPIGSLDPENIGLAVEIVFLSRLQAELSVCHFYRVVNIEVLQYWQ